ncbi:hypothetical protein FRB96_008063 [Tulasnella sp. 330]|nr:hypothetical protein FRB96_008063 [Tulasnella sp. 330]
MSTQALFTLLLSSLHYHLVQAQSANTTDPPFVTQTFSFGWPGVANATMIRCRTLNITVTPLDPSHLPLGPFELNVYSQYRTPLAINAGTVFWHLFPVDLDIGGPYMFSMADAYGGTGGTSLAFNVVADPLGLTCGSSGMVASGLQLNVTTPRAQCGDVAFSVSGGTPPYTMTVLPESSIPKTVTYATGDFNYTLDVRGGVNAFFSVEDALGVGATSDLFTVAESTDASCLGAAATLTEGAPALSTIYPGVSATATQSSSNGSHHKSVLGPIIGGVVGGLLLFCIGLIIGVYFYKKRREASRNWETSLRREGLHTEPIQRMSIDAMSNAMQTPKDELLMKQTGATSITPFNPNLNPNSNLSSPAVRPVSYTSETTVGNWNSSENMRPLSGPAMMVMGGPVIGEQVTGGSGGGGGGGGGGGHSNAPPYPIGAQHPQIQQQQQVMYGYPTAQYPTAQYPGAQPQPWHGPQQGERPMSSDFNGSSTALSNAGSGGAGDAAGNSSHGGAGGGSSYPDEKRQRPGSTPSSNFTPGPGPGPASPSPPYQPNY